MQQTHFRSTARLTNRLATTNRLTISRLTATHGLAGDVATGVATTAEQGFKVTEGACVGST